MLIPTEIFPSVLETWFLKTLTYQMVIFKTKFSCLPEFFGKALKIERHQLTEESVIILTF